MADYEAELTDQQLKYLEEYRQCVRRGADEVFIKDRYPYIFDEITQSVLDAVRKETESEKTKKKKKKEEKQATFKELYPTVEDLKREELGELTWLIQDFLPASGAFILSAKPKTGKTFLALQMAVAVASGKPFLDQFETQKGKVLYVITQGGKRLLKNRIMLVDNAAKLNDLCYQVALPPLEQGGYEELQRFIDLAAKEGVKPRLIVLDMITSLFAMHKHNDYHAWSNATDRLNDFTLKNDIALLGVYHSRKSESDNDDFMDDTLGSTGILSGIGGSLVVRRLRSKSEATIQMNLRDMESSTKTLSFENAKWTLLADRKIPTRTTDNEVLLIVKNNAGLTNKEISEKREYNKDASNTLKVLKRLLEEDFIIFDNGRYFIK